MCYQQPASATISKRSKGEYQEMVQEMQKKIKEKDDIVLDREKIISALEKNNQEQNEVMKDKNVKIHDLKQKFSEVYRKAKLLQENAKNQDSLIDSYVTKFALLKNENQKVKETYDILIQKSKIAHQESISAVQSEFQKKLMQLTKCYERVKGKRSEEADESENMAGNKRSSRSHHSDFNDSGFETADSKSHSSSDFISPYLKGKGILEAHSCPPSLGKVTDSENQINDDKSKVIEYWMNKIKKKKSTIKKLKDTVADFAKQLKEKQVILKSERKRWKLNCAKDVSKEELQMTKNDLDKRTETMNKSILQLRNIDNMLKEFDLLLAESRKCTSGAGELSKHSKYIVPGISQKAASSLKYIQGNFDQIQRNLDEFYEFLKQEMQKKKNYSCLDKLLDIFTKNSDRV